MLAGSALLPIHQSIESSPRKTVKALVTHHVQPVWTTREPNLVIIGVGCQRVGHGFVVYIIVIYSGRVSVSRNGLCNRIWAHFEQCELLAGASTNHNSAGGRIGEVGFADSVGPAAGRPRPSASSHIHET